MAYSISNQAERRMLTKITASNMSIRLFNDDISPSEDDVAATYTGSEPSIGGYAAQTLTGGNWTIATDISGNSTATYNATITFSFSAGPDNIYGFFVLDTASGELMLAETFDGGVVSIPGPGGDIEVNPTLTLA